MRDFFRKRQAQIRRGTIGALEIFAVYMAVCFALAWGTVCRKAQDMTRTPAEFNLRYSSIQFASADGTELRGWLIPAGYGAKGVVICCHGVDSNRMAFLRSAQALHRAGYAVLLFDFRARGESGGGKCTLGYRETEDLLAAVSFVQSRADCRALPIGVLGESMGGAVALMGTARNPAIRCVIAESPFARLDHAIAFHFGEKLGRGGPILGVPTRWIGERLLGKNAAEIAPVAEIPRIAPRPVLLIADADDRLCPPSETTLLFAAAGQPKELWMVPDSGHIGAKMAQPAEYEQRIVDFFTANLRPPPPAAPSRKSRNPHHPAQSKSPYPGNSPQSASSGRCRAGVRFQ